ncbi:hypothetical protein [Micromonospora sp. NPDC049102]|uniref:hypothetical protein n=1 Tax=Micromonospora sp. NPDC049102 TaxID=3364265 RepID=UPI003722CAE6
MRHEEQQVSNDHPEAVRSAPVPVPPTDSTDRRNQPDDEGGFHEPGPLPTAFGATTVADAVAASALASPRPQDQPDPRAERTAAPGDGAEDGEREGLRADPTAELHRRDDFAEVDGDATPESDETDLDVDDRRTVVVPGSTDGAPERRSDLTDWAGDPDAAGYGSASPEMVDPDADADPVATEGTGASLESAGTSRPAGSTVATDAATLLDGDTAQGFRDRWRDVQLRFVDDPQAAAGEAQALVEEAIQALASALAAQKNTLGGWQDTGSADTEQLRMAVRNYRDFLDRVLGR